MGRVLEQDGQVALLESSTTVDEINAALEAHQVVLLEPGTYSFGTDQIIVPADKTLAGFGQAGFGDTFINSTMTASGAFISLGDRATLKNLIIDGPSSGSADGVRRTGTEPVLLDRVLSRNWGRRGFDAVVGDIIRCQASSNGDIGFVIEGNDGNSQLIDSCQANNNGGNGFRYQDFGSTVSNIFFINCYSLSNTGQGIASVSPSGGSISNLWIQRCVFRFNSVNGINLVGDGAYFGVFIIDCEVDNNSNNGMTISSALDNIQYLHITNCAVTANSNTGILVSAPTGVLRHLICSGNASRSNVSGDGISIVVSGTIDQPRITANCIRGNGGDGLFCNGALAGGAASSRGHVIGNISRGNTGSEFNIGSNYLTADNV